MMEKITLKNLLLWDPKQLEAVCEELSEEAGEEFASKFAFDAREVFKGCTWAIPFYLEIEDALQETSRALRREFMKAFTDRRGLDPDDCKSLAPWLHPREWDGTLDGETVKEMAENYAVKNWHEFSWLQEEE